MLTVLTNDYQCPICGQTELKILFEGNVHSEEEYLHSNEYYGHVVRNEVHYFVRKNANIIDEIQDSIFEKQFHVEPQFKILSHG